MIKSVVLVATLLAVLSSGFGGDPISVQGATLGDSVADNTADFLGDPCGLEVVVCEHELSIEDKIRIASREAGIDEETAVRIATCESSLNPKAKNKYSSATGLYQWTIGSWRWIGAENAGLDRFSADDSIAMFMKWYPKYQSWWECK